MHYDAVSKSMISYFFPHKTPSSFTECVIILYMSFYPSYSICVTLGLIYYIKDSNLAPETNCISSWASPCCYHHIHVFHTQWLLFSPCNREGILYQFLQRGEKIEADTVTFKLILGDQFKTKQIIFAGLFLLKTTSVGLLLTVSNPGSLCWAARR